MKTKTSLLALLLLVLFSACQPKFNQYKEAVEDSVRFQLAVANSVSDFTDFYDVMHWYSMVSDMSEQSLQGKSFRDMLVENAEKDPFSDSFLKHYDSVEVLLSEPIEEVSGRVWTFYEINTNLHFTFTLIPAQNGEIYYKCVANEEEFSELVRSNFLERAIDLIK
jgi:hypothetical protein